MDRIKLKCGGQPRNKAFLGALIGAAASVAGSIISSKAAKDAADEQAQAIREQAKMQADAMREMNNNNNKLQKEQLDFTKSENQINRDIQKDIQLSLQMQAGQENMNSLMEQNKAQVKYGGKPKRRKLKEINNSSVLELEGNQNTNQGEYLVADPGSFRVTDGGAVIPVGQLSDGRVLYEAIGNDHEHYHKTKGGKYKSGVGVEFADSSDAYAISKNSIGGFNPVDAVNEGMNPDEAFAIQQYNKEILGVADNGKKAKAGRSFKLKCGGSTRRKGKWGDYAGATYTSIGNLTGARINMLGAGISGNTMAKAYTDAGEMVANAYASLKGIDENLIKRSDFAAPHVLAAVRTPNTNINPQLTRVDRETANQAKLINRGTLSSAARRNSLAKLYDRRNQAVNELYAAKQNADEQIKQANTATINSVASENANRDAEANTQYAQSRLNLLQYNNQIDNQRILGMANARGNAMLQASGAKATASQAMAQSAANAVSSIGNSFATAFNTARTNEINYNNMYAGLNNEQQFNEAVRLAQEYKDTSKLKALYNANIGNSNVAEPGSFADRVKKAYDKLVLNNKPE